MKESVYKTLDTSKIDSPMYPTSPGMVNIKGSKT